MDVELTTAPALRLGRPHALFKRKPIGQSLIFGWPPGFDVSAEDDRFVICQSTSDEKAGGFVVVENWLAPFLRAE